MTQKDRRDPRFALRDEDVIKVEMQCKVGSQEIDPMEAQVVDISRRGAKLKINNVLPGDAEANLELKCEEANWSYRVPAKICWKMPTRNDGWWIGCSFDSPVETVALERLATAGIINRRSEERQTVNTDVQVKLELDSKQHGARLVDISEGGFKIWVEHAVKVGERVVLARIEDGADDFRAVGRARWVKPTGDGFFIGCSFVRPEGFTNLTQALGLHEALIEHTDAKQMSLAHGLSLAVAIAALAFGLQSIFR
jgi:hypothetical protein